MLILFGFDEEIVRDSIVIIVDLRVAEILLSIAEDFMFAVESEVGNSVTLRSVVTVACEGSMVLSDSMIVGFAMIFELLSVVA